MEKFGRWPLVLLAFGFFVSTIYQYGFWSVFGLNVFQYFNPSDVLKNFLYVIMAGFSPVILLMFLLQFFDSNFLKLGERFERKPSISIYGTDGKTTWGKLFKALAKELGTWAIIAAILSGSTLASYSASSFEDYPKWLLYVFICSLAAYIATSPKYDFIGLPSMRWALTILIGYSVIISLTAGRDDGNRIFKGKDFFFSSNNARQVSDYPSTYFKLIGRAGEQTIFISSDNKAVVFLTNDQLSKLQLLHKKGSDKLPTVPVSLLPH